LRQDPSCPLCGTRRTITELIDYEQFCGVAPKNSPFDVTPEAMLAALAHPAPHLMVLDIREDWECVIEPIPGAVQIPMSQLETRLGELDPQQTIYVCCQHGLRSQQVVSYLRANGFAQAKNVLGGVAACPPPSPRR
jgi:adenylyltransferase/sulfurtransferase